MSGGFAPVPPRCRGVWARTLLRTPAGRDESTVVRWLQTASWHADLRVPLAARPPGRAPGPAERALQQGFYGRTSVERRGASEVCSWHRVGDFQPPGPHPDAGRIEFLGDDRLLEIGVHADYEEIWERLPESTGRSAALAPADTADGDGVPAALWLVAGRYAMHVRPRRLPWPADCTTSDTLSDLIRRHPALQLKWLDFEISFGTVAAGRWTIEHSTLPELERTEHDFGIRRGSGDAATIRWGEDESCWRILEWDSAADRPA